MADSMVFDEVGYDEGYSDGYSAGYEEGRKDMARDIINLLKEKGFGASEEMEREGIEDVDF